MAKLSENRCVLLKKKSSSFLELCAYDDGAKIITVTNDYDVQVFDVCLL
jgi:hypothetical protein